ncbi:MAG: hypothetical protein BZY80_05065 [SAR202 cluster bacterium Io17-Chloro-G2]|nr:MAG: hypothetical protein BZY80_05065 [SAR202 cluster bacterium Io17-Chloro-G2]
MSVSSLKIQTIQSYSGGISFGETGPYQQLDGKAHFSVDPNDPSNALITDLTLAPRDAAGMVSFSADFRILQPAELGKGNRRIFFDVVNRGNPLALKRINSGLDGADPTSPMDPGNGYLMRQGYSLVWCGWQHDVPDVPGLFRIDPPQAFSSTGEPVAGNIAVTFQPNSPTQVQMLSDRNHRPHPANNLEDWNSVLTVQDHDNGKPVVIPREEWSFGLLEEGKVVPSASHIYMASGFQAGMIYQVIYSTNGAPVVGVGLLSARDLVSFLRYASSEDGNPCAQSVQDIQQAYAFGSSQSGRFLRQLLYLGLNRDERDRRVFDGVISHIAGGRRGEFNQRFGQPSSLAANSVNNLFPFSSGDQTDPETGLTGGVLSRTISQGNPPKVIFTNSSAEYWGGHAALTHLDVTGTRDVEPPDSVRIYHFAGTQHGAGTIPLKDADPSNGNRGRHTFNTVDYRPLLRAAVENLDAWVTNGDPPPTSLHPRISDATAVSPEVVGETFRTIPGASFLDHLPHVSRLDFGPDPGVPTKMPPAVGKPFPSLVSAVDSDGNEMRGIRLPDVAVPLATHTGWNVRHPDMAGAGQIIKQIGSTIPFPATKEGREAPHDPRPSIEERYTSKEDYLNQVSRVAQDLVDQRYLLAEDVPRVEEHAAQRYDLFSRSGVEARTLEQAPAGDG